LGKDDIAALIAVLEAELAKPGAGVALGTWKIDFDKKRGAFVFDKCENEGYCEERPAVVALNGEILDAGGPLFG
jgi:hypothetical protein